jgi:RNA polymerase sigma-70 factor (ECF subfamily)
MTSPGSPTAVLDPNRLHIHLPRLTRFATRLSGSREAGEDLVQETLERVLRSPRRVSGSEFAYLARALRNSHVDRVRADVRRTQTTTEPAVLESIAAPERTAVSLEARAVLEAVAQLPDDYREVVVAVDVSGLSYAEAAEGLGIPIGTVMSRLYRGRRRVMQAVGG